MYRLFMYRREEYSDTAPAFRCRVRVLHEKAKLANARAGHPASVRRYALECVFELFDAEAGLADNLAQGALGKILAVVYGHGE